MHRFSNCLETSQAIKAPRRTKEPQKTRATEGFSQENEGHFVERSHAIEESRQDGFCNLSVVARLQFDLKAARQLSDLCVDKVRSLPHSRALGSLRIRGPSKLGVDSKVQMIDQILRINSWTIFFWSLHTWREIFYL